MTCDFDIMLMVNMVTKHADCDYLQFLDGVFSMAVVDLACVDVVKIACHCDYSYFYRHSSLSFPEDCHLNRSRVLEE